MTDLIRSGMDFVKAISIIQGGFKISHLTAFILSGVDFTNLKQYSLQNIIFYETRMFSN